MEKRLKAFVIQELRRSSYKWKPRNDALRKAYAGKDGKAYLYYCNYCKGKYKKQSVNIDHINPVVDLFKDDYTLDDYADRLFCPVSGFQILCKPCHDSKTHAEDVVKKDYQKKRLTKKQCLAKLEDMLTELKKGNHENF